MPRAPLQSQGEPFLNSERRVCAIPGVPIAAPQAQGEPTVTTHRQTQHALRELWGAIFVIAVGRTRGHRCSLLLSLRVALGCRGLWEPCRGPRERHGRRILLHPQGWQSIDGKGLSREGAQDLVQVGGKQGVKNLPQAVSVERGSL